MWGASAAPVERAAAFMAAEPARTPLGGARAAGPWADLARVRRERAAVAVGNQHRGTPRGVRTDRSVRQPPWPQSRHAAQPGAAGVASAGASRWHARVLRARHGRAP